MIGAYLEDVRARAARANAPGAVARPARGREAAWVEVPADEVSEALLQAWAVNGLDHVFFCSGTDLVWMQEGAVKLRSLGRPTPRLVTMLHEFVALSAAHGYSMVARRPSMTAAHVDVGTLNYGGAIHNAWRDGQPILITSGKTPSAYGGTARGDRDQPNLWAQDQADQGAILRQYTRWDHDLRAGDNPGLVVGRALQVALSPPWGPVYLSIARDVAMAPAQGARFPSVAQLGVPEPPAADPEAIRRAARWLVEAERPLVISQYLGRDPAAVAPMVELAELLALPFSDPRRERMSFPLDHPLYEGGPPLEQADAVLVVEATAPWQPGYHEPSPEARVIHLGHDPALQRHLYYEFTADLRIAADPALALAQLRDEVDRLLTERHRRAIAERRERIAAASAARRARLEREAQALAGRAPISPAYLSYELGRVLPDDALVLNEAVSSAADVMRYAGGTRPGTLFHSGATGGGWGPGAAFGAALAAPGRLVALATGDGFFLYGVPYAALWSALRERVPFLTVVYQNNGYTTGTTSVAHYYPDGYAARLGDFEGGVIEPPLDLAKLAESAGAAGENVSDPAQVRPALERAIKAVEQGVPAVVAVQLATVGRGT